MGRPGQENGRFWQPQVYPEVLKTGITPRIYEIIKKADKQLFNERIRCINNILHISGIKRDTCYNRLKSMLDQDTIQECWSSINRVRESRHSKVIDRQKENLTDCFSKREVAAQMIIVATYITMMVLAVPVTPKTTTPLLTIQ